MDMFEGKKLKVKHGYLYFGKKLVHRAIWEQAYGKIPIGHHIHHIDGDKKNNSLENLQCLSHSAHLSLHANERKKELATCMSANNEKLHEWHRSEIGRKTLSQRAKKQWQERKLVKMNCIECKKDFETIRPERTKYCSPSCQQAARRAAKIDNEERSCLICSKPFIINKYQLTKTCSFPCRNLLLSKSKTKSKL